MPALLHLTDLHLSVAQPTAAAKAEMLRDLAARLPAMRVPPAAVILSGDLADTGDADSYAALRPLLAAFPVPVLTALGNHDRRGSFHAAFGTGAGEAPHHHEAELAGLRVLVLDSSVPGRVSGALDADQLAWLAARLAARPDVPALIVVHHPPQIDPSGLPWASLDAPSTAALAGTIRGHRVAGILSGHIHLDRVVHWQGVPVVTNVGLHYAVDPLAGDGLRLVEGAGLSVCQVTTGGGLSVAFHRVAPQPVERGRVPADRLRSFT